MNRRSVLTAAGFLGAGSILGALPACSEPQQTPAAPKTAAGHAAPGAALTAKKTAFAVSDTATVEDAFNGYCNFYEFGTSKDDPPRYASRMTVVALAGDGRRRDGCAGRICAEGPDRLFETGRAHLSPSLRRGVVDGDPVDRRADEGRDREAEAESDREVRAVRNLPQRQGDVRRQPARAAMAVCRGPAPRRGDERAAAVCRRRLWQGAAEAERRAAAHGDPVEVRLQGDEVRREDPLHRDPAGHGVEQGQRPANTASIPT